MKRILIVQFSQSGQLVDVVNSVCGPLLASDNIEVVIETLEPVEPYPFPWSFIRFFNTFPECIHADPGPIRSPRINSTDRFDLVILAYQVWFLSPSLPMQAFLNSSAAAAVLRDTDVITLIGCRNMWLKAQETMKTELLRLGARLIDNIVLTDSAHSAFTFFSTPMWVLTGQRGPWLNGWVPRAGIAPERVSSASRFGQAIATQLPTRSAGDVRPMLAGLGAVEVNERLIASEQIAHRSFTLWGHLLRALGGPDSLLRKCILGVYIVFLVTLILTVVPISALIKWLITPLTKAKTARQKKYYAAPSGEGRDLMDSEAESA